MITEHREMKPEKEAGAKSYRVSQGTLRTLVFIQV